MKSTQLKKFFPALVLAVVMFGVFTQSNLAVAQDSNLVTVIAKAPFAQTVDAFRTMVAKNGMMVLSELNQGKILSMTGMKLNTVTLFVGNPTIGKKLFSANHGVGVAIPVRINIYEGADGKTLINYVKPSAQLAFFPNEAIQKVGAMLDKKLAMLTSMLSK
ncbi:MAG: hypothetical protein CO090_03345 [Acidobacteria bacterium CG_4_9_14_3_um_filter_49_7]|nr:MAG: hypothetical protein CO090_03345 [Acidobacteria bacterium CG_4_9_14_3_um_filter_49_7]